MWEKWDAQRVEGIVWLGVALTTTVACDKQVGKNRARRVAVAITRKNFDMVIKLALLHS